MEYNPALDTAHNTCAISGIIDAQKTVLVTGTPWVLAYVHAWFLGALHCDTVVLEGAKRRYRQSRRAPREMWPHRSFTIRSRDSSKSSFICYVKAKSKRSATIGWPNCV
jgi:hypothetical protein